MNFSHWPQVFALARLVVFMTALTVVLAMTAERFDDTEIRTLVTMFLVGAGAEGIGQVVGRFKGAS